MRLNDLYKEFPRGAIHWRAQSLTKDKKKAKALAYLDARDVMDRLDNVCGPHGWQDEYTETPSGRVLCTIRIKVGDEWIGKTDGSGSTDIEGEKGGISGAFKRAAVKWGVGRYLYDMPAPWVPCKTYNDKFDDWSDDPWKYVRNAPKPAPELNADVADAPPPVNAPKKLKPAEDCINQLDGSLTVEGFVHAVANTLRAFPEKWPREVTEAAERNAEKLDCRLVDVGRRARAINAAEGQAA